MYSIIYSDITNVNEVIPEDIQQKSKNEKPINDRDRDNATDHNNNTNNVPFSSSSSATSSTYISSTEKQPDMIMDEIDKEKCLVGQQRQPRVLKTWDRPDIRREPRRIVGWTLARWLLLISNIVVNIFIITFEIYIIIIIIIIIILTIFFKKIYI